MAYRDKEKQRLKHKEYYLKNKELWNYEKRKSSHDKYRKKHSDKLKASGKERYWDNKEKRLQNVKKWRVDNEQYVKTKDKANTEELTDKYMRKHLLKLGYTRFQIRKYPDLLESHRLIIKIKRLCKTSKN